MDPFVQFSPTQEIRSDGFFEPAHSLDNHEVCQPMLEGVGWQSPALPEKWPNEKTQRQLPDGLLE